MMKKIARDAGVPTFAVHDLRRTCNTDLQRAGVGPILHAEMTGQNLKTVGKYYFAADDQMVDDALAAVESVRNRTADSAFPARDAPSVADSA